MKIYPILTRPFIVPFLPEKNDKIDFFQHYYTVINVVVTAVFYRLLRQNVAHNCDCCDDDYFILKTIGEKKNAQKEEEKNKGEDPSHLVRKRLMITIIFFSGTSAENSLNVVLSY